MRKVVAALLMVFVLAGCGPVDDRGGSNTNGEWDKTDLTQCDVPDQPPPGRVFGPRPGYVHILVVVTADRYRIENNKQVCVPNITLPFTIRLDAKLDGIRAVKLDRGRTMPWTERISTPHFEHLYAPLTGKARIWEVDVHAVVQTLGAHPPLSYIRCAIFVDGNRAARHSAKIKQGLSTASCAASGPTS